MATAIEYGLPGALAALQAVLNAQAVAGISHMPVVTTTPPAPVDPAPVPDAGGVIIGTPEAPTAGL